MNAYLHELGIACSLGSGAADVARGLLAASETDSVVVDAQWLDGRAPVGQVPARALDTVDLAPGAGRTLRVLALAAQQLDVAVHRAVERHGAHRVGVVLGTSTGGIHEAGQAVAAQLRDGHFPAAYDYRHQVLGQPAAWLVRRWALRGPCQTIATACTSSALALQSARRLLRLGVCDVVVCGGVDGLSDMSLHGFSALEAVAPERCNPFSRQRRGINIGEGAALFLMSAEPAPVALLAAAAGSDAYHMAAPRPDGEGARRTMQAALADAGLAAGDIDYLNLHGTATRQNDAMESRAVAALFPQGVPCSSTKPLTGHTLGAAGALEAAFCWLAIGRNPEGRLPPHRWDGHADPELPALDFTTAASRLPTGKPRRLMSNSFAFGGSNACLILGDAT
ncbi:MAG: 3-oxoacyl-[acyl-carrier-protein] synthase 2 [Paracidovorax wautersii]|uniref:3-oxoacyl-[acyl-carrier-protein] synthase 2 n=1 Tax=Paracidovorax wautersii TaxID=1177982 RepID=A0A7V8FR46_9BURK|nr:MAG: 3-oxoacyl-[acyl-carrier-protein] synthase 2 [Paracidovorax wautersii]